MKPMPSILLCCLLAAPLAWSFASPADAASQPKGHVTVSKPAASLPGRRYAWVEMPATLAAEFDERAKDPALRQRLQAALDKALQAKGYELAPSIQQADLALAYRVGIRDTELSLASDPYSGAGESAIECRAGDCSQIVIESNDGAPIVKVSTQHLIEGGLMVEVLKPNEIRVLWRALYRGQVQARHRGKVNLDAIATKTLAQLPKAPAAAP